jgi:hypothetical protein
MRADKLFKLIAVILAFVLIMAWMTSCKSVNYQQKVKGRTANFR